VNAHTSTRMLTGTFGCELTAAALLGALKPLSRVIPRTVVIPITGHVWLRPDEKGLLQLTATDLKQSLTVNLDAPCEGAITAPIDRLLAFAVLLTRDAPVNISAADGFLTARSGRSSCRVPTLDASDFPTGTVGEVRGTKWEFAPQRLTTMLKSLQDGAVPATDPRRYLCGIAFHYGKDRATLVSTNGHILGEELAAELAGTASGAFILGREAIAPVLDLCHGDETVTLTLASDSTAATFATALKTFRAALIDGVYPDYRRAVPDYQRATVATVGREDFLTSLRIAGNVSDALGSGADSLTAVAVRISGSEIELSSHSKGEAGEDACGATVSGPDVSFGASFGYLKWAAESFADADTIEMRVVDGGTAVQFTSPDRPGAMRLVFPRRV
jgi:DNA polymerase III sliding clamp (beta) subunit (PCNA family)